MFYKLLLGPGLEKGFLLLGALFALQLRGHLKHIEEFIGVSVGSLVAFYIVIGVSFNELFDEALEFNLFETWREFDILAWFLSEGSRGLVKSNKIRERLEFWMKCKFGRSLTFLELYQLTGKKFTVTITDKSDAERPQSIYINHENYPNYQVSEAVIESCTIPGLIEQKNPNHIDGAFSDPMPIQLLGNTPSIAFILRDSGDAGDSNLLTKPFEKVLESFFIPMQILVEQKIQHIGGNVKAIVLRRNIRNVIPRKLTMEEKKNLIQSGFKQTYNLM